jgi:hypothetical protein
VSAIPAKLLTWGRDIPTLDCVVRHAPRDMYQGCIFPPVLFSPPSPFDYRAMMGCSGFLIVVAAFCLHTSLFSNRHYLAFGLVVIPSVLIMAVGARLMRSAITYPSAEGKTIFPSQS